MLVGLALVLVLACPVLVNITAVMYLYASQKSRLKKRKHRVWISKYLRVRPQYGALNSIFNWKEPRPLGLDANAPPSCLRIVAVLPVPSALSLSSLAE